MKGHRVGTSGAGQGPVPGPSRSAGQVASRLVNFWCHSGHRTTVRLAADVHVPQLWPCARCGASAGPNPNEPPPAASPHGDRGRTHLDQLRMRRTPEQGERALAEALDRLHTMRAAGEVS